MKNIFKKNQIIITALAIMIAVAGYLNFAKDNTKDSAKDVAASTNEALGEDIFASDKDGEEYADIGDDTDQLALDDKGNLILDENQTASDDKESTDVANKEEGKDSQQASNDATGEALASDSTDGSTQVMDDQNANPGEAVLASSNIVNSGYFSNAKLLREQNRAKNRENLMTLIDNTNISDEKKQEAIDKVLELTAISEKECATEIQLGAKGFSDAVVTIVDGQVDVVVNAPSLTEQDMAIIEDVVMTKTDAKLDHIKITAAIIEE